MTYSLRVASLAFFSIIVAIRRAPAQASPIPKICEERVGLVTTDFRYKVPTSQMARIELRQCEVGGAETVQIVIWRAGATSPAMVIESGDFGVVQVFCRANVFVLETGGATTDQVFVIIYRHGSPSLELRKTTRGTATLTASPKFVDVLIEGIFAGADPDRTEKYRFDLVADEAPAK